MSRKKLNYIIALMSIALLGLVGLQFYWINNAIKIKEDRFKQSVHEMLNAVVKRLEHREVLYITRESIAREGVDKGKAENSRLEMKFDSTGTARWQENRVITKKQILSSQALSTQGLEIEVQEEAIISKTGVARRNKVGNAVVFGLNPENIAPLIDSINYFKNQETQRYLKFANKSEMVSVVLESLVNFDRPIEERITASLLDSLLKMEAVNKGINIPCQFGVIDTRNYKLLFAEKADRLGLVESGFRVQLFPNDALAYPSYLYLNFPDQQQYIFKEMLTVFSSSVALIAVICFCFGMAIFTIIRQKKISEITNDFINNMTHEFKTPIATVSLACEVMQDPDMRSNEKQLLRYLQIIKDENDRLGMQVEKVLQIATLERGDFKLKIEPLNVHDIINKALHNITFQIESREGTISTELEAENSYIEADEIHLTNIVYNLLDNANKYSPNAPEIKIATENMKNGIVITISDKGLGISKDTINRVFDKFYRVPTGNIHNVKGFGLGLSYVKTMVDAHFGSISVKSELHKGSTFTIFLPYKHNESN